MIKQLYQLTLYAILCSWCFIHVPNTFHLAILSLQRNEGQKDTKAPRVQVQCLRGLFYLHDMDSVCSPLPGLIRKAPVTCQFTPSPFFGKKNNNLRKEEGSMMRGWEKNQHTGSLGSPATHFAPVSELISDGKQGGKEYHHIFDTQEEYLSFGYLSACQGCSHSQYNFLRHYCMVLIYWALPLPQLHLL